MTDALWQAVKARQQDTRRLMSVAPVHGRRPTYLFSKLTQCAVCGGGYHVWSREVLRCFNNQKRNTCSNTRSITRQELEGRVLRALQERFLADADAFAEFCAGFTEEMNQQRREHRTRMAAAPRELAALNRRSHEILELLLQGFRDEAWKAELHQIERRRAELEATIASAEAEPTLPALHPHMAVVYRQKVEALAAALSHEDDALRESARESLRGFITAIVIPPGDGLLEVRGDLGMMLAATGRDGEALACVQGGCGGPQPAGTCSCPQSRRDLRRQEDDSNGLDQPIIVENASSASARTMAMHRNPHCLLLAFTLLLDLQARAGLSLDRRAVIASHSPAA